MADHTLAANEVAIHTTLTASTVETITFPTDLNSVEIVSDGTAAVYYTIDGTTPTIGGNNCYVLPAGNAAVDTREPPTATNSVVQLISTGTPVISVQRGTY